MSLFPHEWTEQNPWACPKCGKILYTSVRTDTNDWDMCIECESKERAERMAYKHQQEITKHNLLTVNPVKITIGRDKYLRMRIEAIVSDLMTGRSRNLDNFNNRYEMAHYKYNWKTGKAELMR